MSDEAVTAASAAPATATEATEAATTETDTTAEASTEGAETTEATEANAKDPKAAPSNLAKAKAAAERAKRSRIEKEHLRKQHAATSQRLAASEAQLQRLDAERRQYAEQLDRAKKDPLGYLRDAGIGADVVARQAIQDMSPETKYERAIAEANAKIEALQTRIEERAQAEQTAQYEQREQRVQAEFIKGASDPSAYPHLAPHARVRGRAIIAEAETLIRHAREKFNDPTYAPSMGEVLSALDSIYAQVNGSNPAHQKTEQGERTSTKDTDGIGSASQDSTSGKSRTLTSKLQARGSMPKGFDEMDSDEQKAHLLRLYRDTVKASRG